MQLTEAGKSNSTYKVSYKDSCLSHRQSVIYSEAAVQVDKESITAAFASACTDVHELPFANHDSQSGSVLPLLTVEEDICQSVHKMSFYSNHLSNHCILMRKNLQAVHLLLPQATFLHT